MKSIRLLHTSLLGLLGGVLGWSLLQSGYNIFDALSTKVFPELNSNWINEFNYEGALIGLGLGLVLQARASILNHHDLMGVLFKMFIGAFLGAIFGLICFWYWEFIDSRTNFTFDWSYNKLDTFRIIYCWNHWVCTLPFRNIMATDH